MLQGNQTQRAQQTRVSSAAMARFHRSFQVQVTTKVCARATPWHGPSTECSALAFGRRVLHSAYIIGLTLPAGSRNNSHLKLPDPISLGAVLVFCRPTYCIYRYLTARSGPATTAMMAVAVRDSESGKLTCLSCRGRQVLGRQVQMTWCHVDLLSTQVY